MLKNAIKHFITITKHRHKVISHCAKAGILFQGFFHDLSKYSYIEFIQGIKHYQGTRSPNEEERELKGFSEAWLHHKGRNKHHFEYWMDYEKKTKIYSPVPMPDKYIIEMFCDRVAASKVYRGNEYKDSDPLDYFMKSKNTRQIHPETSDKLEALLVMLAEKGEDAAFTYIKNSFIK